jgi:hypothetical protein
VKNIIWATIGVIMGLGFMIFGFTSQRGDVECGGKVMHQGDTCVTIGGGGGSRNYDEQKSKSARTGWIGVGVGALFVVGGGAVLAWEIRDRRRAASATPPAQL